MPNSDRKEYDRIVDSVEGDEEIKINLKNLWPKFKGKTQDAIIESSFVKSLPGAIIRQISILIIPVSLPWNSINFIYAKLKANDNNDHYNLNFTPQAYRAEMHHILNTY